MGSSIWWSVWFVVLIAQGQTDWEEGHESGGSKRSGVKEHKDKHMQSKTAEVRSEITTDK